MTMHRWLKIAGNIITSIVMLLVALYAISRIYFLVGYGYELLDYPHTGILHEYYYMPPYVLEFRILSNWTIIVGVFCYFLAFKGALYIFTFVLLIKLLGTWFPTLFSGYVLFVPGMWHYKLIPTIFWIAIVAIVFLKVRKAPVSKD